MPKNDATVNIYILRSKCLRGLWESKPFLTSVRGVRGTMGGSVNGKFLIYYILLMMFQKLEVKKIVWLRNIIMEIFIQFLNKCEWPILTWITGLFEFRSSPRCHGSRRVHNDANKFSLTFELVAAPFSASEIEGHGWSDDFWTKTVRIPDGELPANRNKGDMVHRLNKVELQCKASFECHSHENNKVRYQLKTAPETTLVINGNLIFHQPRVWARWCVSEIIWESG